MSSPDNDSTTRAMADPSPSPSPMFRRPPKAPQSNAGAVKTVKGAGFFLAYALGAVGLWFSLFNSSTSARVQTAVWSPNGKTSTEPFDNMLFVLACMGACGVFDTVVAARYA